jgi:ribosomal protein S18 acetylase RimI-like enzyme
MPANPCIILARDRLDVAEQQSVAAFIAQCNMLDHLDLKINRGLTPSGAGQNDYFLAYSDEDLVGYAALDRGNPTEVCGVVHPNWRRQGIGRALLDAMVSECRKSYADRILLICEDASPGGQAMMERIGADHSFSELRMVLANYQRRPPVAPQMIVRHATRADIEAIALLISRAFDDGIASARARLDESIDAPSTQYYLAELDGSPIGCLNIFRDGDGSAGIYGFSVRPDLRGKGYGRQFMTTVIDDVLQSAPSRITLEVLTRNAPAVGLYRSVGFAEETVYGYFIYRL